MYEVGCDRTLTPDNRNLQQYTNHAKQLKSSEILSILPKMSKILLQGANEAKLLRLLPTDFAR